MDHPCGSHTHTAGIDRHHPCRDPDEETEEESGTGGTGSGRSGTDGSAHGGPGKTERGSSGRRCRAA